MPLEGHLDELRRRMMVSAFVILPVFIVLFVLSHQILGLVVDSARPYLKHLVFLSPQEALFTYLKLTFALSLVIASPVWLYESLMFVMPALGRSARGYVLRILPMLILLFLGGIAFGYFVFLPIVMRFLVGFGTRSGVEPMVTIGNYISFMLSVTIPLGIVFETPIASYILTTLGVIHPQTLRKGRRVAIMAAFIVAAIFAPPDAFSMIVMALPMLALYEAAIIVCAVTERRMNARRLRRQLQETNA